MAFRISPHQLDRLVLWPTGDPPYDNMSMSIQLKLDGSPHMLRKVILDQLFANRYQLNAPWHQTISESVALIKLLE